LLSAAVVASLLNVPFWWDIQSALTNSVLLAAMMTIGCVLIPPILLSFLFPSNPAGALVARLNAKLPGNILVVAASLWFLYYGYTMQHAYWQAQPAGAQGYAWEQALLGMVLGVVVPTLAWGMVGVSDLAEELRQIQLVRKYKLEADAQIAYIRAQIYRAQEIAAKSIVERTAAERAELAAIVPQLFRDMEETRQQMGQHFHEIAETNSTFTLRPNSEIQYVLDYYQGVVRGEFGDFESAEDVRPQLQ
jgi:heme/copper-type cytochrome/quinol oxidase subunit 4/uncharacterized membrane-anchored protein YhcB (DUF1043 family)